MFSRRDFGKIALAAFPVARAMAAKIDSRFHGVRIGAQTYSFRDMGVDDAINAMKQIGIGECELFMGHVEPKDLKGAALTRWRLETPLDYFQGIRKKFDDAGIKIYAYCLNFRDDFSDAELDRGFEMTKALGTNVITTSTTLTCARRLAPLAAKHQVKVAMHGHDAVDKPNEFSTPESFQKALEMSPQFYINLDIGHFYAAGYDPVSYIEQHHDKILVIHVKDRKRDQVVDGKVKPFTGANLPFGEGDTPIKQVLVLLRDKKYNILADIEYEYGKEGVDTVANVRKCFEYCKQALA